MTSSELVADASVCWCVILANMLCMKPALFIEITAPCAVFMKAVKSVFTLVFNTLLWDFFFFLYQVPFLFCC